MIDWKSLSPAKKRKIIIGVVIGFVILAATLVANLAKKETYKGIKTDTEVSVLVPRKRDTTVEQLAGQIVSMEKRVQDLERQVLAVEPNMKKFLNQKFTEFSQKKTNEDEQRIKTIEQKLDILIQDLSSKATGPGSVGSAVKAPPPPELQRPAGKGFGDRQAMSDVPMMEEDNEVPEKEAPPPQLRVIGDDVSDSSDVKRKDQKNAQGKGEGGVSSRDMLDEAEVDEDKEALIPAGSIIQGVLLSGMDAPSGGRAAKNPVPALVRVKHEAILPNRFRHDVKECFVIVSGYGSLSTERANLRSERLSCVRPDGGVIETGLDGWVIGEDGKAGMRGRLVSKQGRVIANSIVAGVLSGLAGSFRPQTIPSLNLTPSSTMQYQFPTPEGVFTGAGLGGANKALEKIADYYLEMANEIFPIIEIDAGRKMTIVLVKGAKLRF